MLVRFPHIPSHATVPIVFAVLLRRFLDEHATAATGILIAPIPENSEDPLASYPARLFCEQLASASAALNDPLIGLKLGMRFKPSDLGALGYVLTSSANLGDALSKLRRYYGMVHDTNELKLIARAGQLILEWPDHRGRFGPLFEEMGLAAFVQSFRTLRAGSGALPRIDFLNTAPSEASPYINFFGGDVRFEQDATRIYIPVSYLSLPFSSHDPVLQQLLERQIQIADSGASRTNEMEPRVRVAVFETLRSGPATMDRVASELRLSLRQFRNVLAKRGISYRAVVQDCLRETAELHLSDPRRTVQSIAEQLGYSEHSAFSRAFQGWAGCSPAEYRKRLMSKRHTI